MSPLYHRFREWLRTGWGRILEINDSPNAIAGGVAIGIVAATTPLFGAKLLLGLLFATVLRCNRIAMAVAVMLHDVTIPIMPLLLRWEYDIGYWLLSHPHHLPPSVHLEHLQLRDYLRLGVLNDLVWPMLLGSFVISLPVAAVFFWITRRVLQGRGELGGK